MITKCVFNYSTAKEHLQDTVASKLVNDEQALVIDMLNSAIIIVKKDSDGVVTSNELSLANGVLKDEMAEVLKAYISAATLTEVLKDYIPVEALTEVQIDKLEELSLVGAVSINDLIEVPIEQLDKLLDIVNGAYKVELETFINERKEMLDQTAIQAKNDMEGFLGDLNPAVLPELTTERIVATLEGKNVYEKVIIGNVTSTQVSGSEEIANLKDLNIDILLSVNYASQRSSTYTDFNNCYYSSTNYTGLYYDHDNKILLYYWAVARKPGPMYITIRYTKKDA